MIKPWVCEGLTLHTPPLMMQPRVCEGLTLHNPPLMVQPRVCEDLTFHNPRTECAKYEPLPSKFIITDIAYLLK